MESRKTLQDIATLAKEIEALPRGYISRKTINGKVYYYHQWSVNGVKHSCYLKNDELEMMVKQIEKRKKCKNNFVILKQIE